MDIEKTLADAPDSKPNPQGAPTPPVQASPVPFRHDRLGSLLLRFLNRLKTTGKSAHTIAAYRNDLSLFSEFLTEKSFDPQLFTLNIQEEWLHYLRQNGRKSQASVRRALMSVRTFMHFLVTEKIIIGSPFLEVKSPRQPSHDLLTILPAHFKSLIATLKKKALLGDEKAIRDWCLVLMLGQAGLKASEAASVTWGDLLIEGPASSPTGGSLRVPGPNERLLKFDADLALALHLLKGVRQGLGLETAPRAHLFFGYMNVSRKTRTSSLHRHGIKFVIYEACEELLSIPYNSESLRNHAILRWLEQGLSAQQVADLAGYSSLNSLERFSLKARGLRKPKRNKRTE